MNHTLDSSQAADNEAPAEDFYDCADAIEEPSTPRWGPSVEDPSQARSAEPPAGSTSTDSGHVDPATIERLESSEEDTNCTLRLFEEMKDETGYLVSTDNEKMRLLYKQEADTTIHRFIFHATLPCDALHLVVLMREWDLVETWNKFTLDTKVLAQVSTFCLWVYSGIWLPWPISQREFIVQARAVDLLDGPAQHLVFLLDSSGAGGAGHPEQCDVVLAGIKGAKGRERIDVKPSIIALRPLTPETVRASVYFNVDPNMRLVPPWLVQFVLMVMVPWVLERVLKIIKKMFSDKDSVYPRRMEERKPLFDFVKRRFAAALAAST